MTIVSTASKSINFDELKDSRLAYAAYAVLSETTSAESDR